MLGQCTGTRDGQARVCRGPWSYWFVGRKVGRGGGREGEETERWRNEERKRLRGGGMKRGRD